MLEITLTIVDIRVVTERIGKHIVSLTCTNGRWHYRIEGYPRITSRLLYPCGYRSEETVRRAVKRQISKLQA